jgi:hypothetical protein
MAVTGTGTKTIICTAAADSVPGPLQIEAIQWTGSIVAADSLKILDGSNVVFQDAAIAGRLGGLFPVNKEIPAGHTAVVNAMSNGACILHLK